MQTHKSTRKISDVDCNLSVDLESVPMTLASNNRKKESKCFIVNGRESEEVVCNSFTDTVLSIHRVWFWLFLFPHRIQYDERHRKYVLKRACILRVIACVLWQGALFHYILWATTSKVFDGIQKVHQAIINLGYMTYWVFHVLITNFWWRKGADIVNILNEGSRILRKLQVNSVSKVVKYCTWPFILTFTGTTILFTLNVLHAAMINWAKSDHAPLIDISEIVRKTLSSYCSFYYEMMCGSEIHSISSGENLGNSTLSADKNGLSLKAYTIFSFITTLGLVVEVFCVYVHLAITFWAFYFKHILQSFLEKVERGGLMNLQEVIVIFNEITSLLEEWNKIFGSPVLSVVVSSLFYKIITLSAILDGDGIGIMWGILTILYYVPFVLLLLACAEVRRLVTVFPSIIKKMFIISGDQQLRQISNLHGMQLIYHDILSSTVGIKGLEFFTISYAFIAQLLGIIFTLSMVTIQLNSYRRGDLDKHNILIKCPTH